MKQFPLYVLFLIGLGGCSSAPDEDSNLPPTVLITSSPITGDTTSYTATVSWTGEDPDGTILHFELTVDPDRAFSEDEIAHGGPGIVALFMPGQNGAPDTTRMVKNGAVSFDWIHTRETKRNFVFTTPNAESLNAEPTGRFEGMHAIYVRAIDNDAAPSNPAKLAVTAETVAPSAHIIRPNIAEEIQDLGPFVTLEWTGSDPDGHSSDLHYQLKLIRLDALEPPVPILQAAPGLLTHDPAPWTPLVGTGPISIPLSVPAEYLLGIRAVDAAGAVEPFLDFGRNVFKFQAFPAGGNPDLVLRTPVGGVAFRGTGNPLDIEIVTGTFQVQVECSAERYGETCNGWRWGLDLADRDAPDGWSEWTTDPTLPEIRFSGPGIHVLYVDARDNASGMTRAALVLHVYDAPFDREVLLVDDSFDNVAPNDAENDAFWRDLVTYYAAHSDLSSDQFFTYEVHGPDDRGSLEPNVPVLSELLRYRLLVWNCGGSGYNDDTALLRATALSPRLLTYLSAGGKVWVTGHGLLPIFNYCPYPGACADLDVGGSSDFFCRYFGLCTDLLLGSTQAKDALVEAIPYPGMDLPTLLADPLKGTPRSETVLHPIIQEDIPDFVGDIDSVFAHGAAGPRLDPPAASSFDGKPVALRWHDPDPQPTHGRTEWFGFSMYFFDQAGARETFQKTLDWFREEVPTPSPGSLRP
jgi:hypothetical protein